MIAPRLVLFARYPESGAAKTRLIPAVGAAGAAQIHRRLTERTHAILQASGCPVELQFTGAPETAFRAWLGEAITAIPQADGGLGDRLISALDPAPVIFFGADTPDLDANHVAAAIDALCRNDVVVGPAHDGGYYLIGLNQPHRFLFENMPWSTDQVLPETLERLNARQITHALLPTLADCDRPEDLKNWPYLIAETALP
ncbi:MAG: TIGR04282 family arsenosugar biosynthesis glycosyltransferase [Erythrobacter sp.]